MPIIFQTPLNNFPLELESIGNFWQQDAVTRQNGHPYFHWLQTEKGSGKLTIDKQTFELGPSKGILIAPFVPHHYLPSSTGWQTNFLTFRGPMTSMIHQLIDHQNYLLAEETDNFSFQEWISVMVSNIQEKQPIAMELSTNCYYFLLQILQQQKTQTTHPLYKKYVQPSLTYIHTHLSEELTVQILANQSFVSPQYLSRLFNKFVSMSPYQYILEARIHTAKELLLNQPTQSIQFISQSVGFESASQFSMVFKKKTTFTPKQFRQQY